MDAGPDAATDAATDAAAEVAPAEVLDATARDAALTALLETQRMAVVLAMDRDARPVPLPDDPLFAGRAASPRGESVLALVEPGDEGEAARIWAQARSTGLGQGHVRLTTGPGTPVTLAVVDVRHRFGVLVAVLLPDGDPDTPAGEAFDPAVRMPPRPRTASVRKNVHAVVLDVDDRLTGMLGWTREEIVGRRSLDFVHPEDAERAVRQWLELRGGRSSRRVRLRHRHRDGSWLWVEIENEWVGMDRPDGVVAIATMTDISDEMAAHDLVQQRERRFRRLTESLPVGVFQVSAECRIEYANARLATLLGVTGAATLREQLATVDERDRVCVEAAVGAALTTGTDRDVEVDVRRPGDGETYRCQFTVAALAEDDGRPGAIVSVTDVTDSARMREELRIRATFDPLTGCLNRSATLAALERALDRSSPCHVAVIFVDLDDFKRINDTYGHAAGDDVLRVVARRLDGQARRTDTVGRIGGDEFLVICHGVVDEAEARAVSARIARALHGRVRTTGRRLSLAASVGVALAQPGVSSDTLVARADAAMYDAKRSGIADPVVYHSGPTP